ncbi:MAG: hypothetical protein NTU83_14055, partial [Candidatus Hydrogenedentes bacterium]|nr:hypothetical protein [Candidatus Hydrogenedentota bacterium]
ALWGFLAGAIARELNPVRVTELLESFEAIVRNPLYRKDFLPSMVVHGVLRFFDIPDLVAFYAGRELLVKYAAAW